MEESANDSSILVVKRLYYKESQRRRRLRRRSLSEPPSAKGSARGLVRVCPGRYKERKKDSRKVRNVHTRAHTYMHPAGREEEAESDEAREQVGKRDALALSMRWKEEMEEEEEEVGRREALARDTRTRHTINTIFALPLHPIPPPPPPPPRPNPPSIRPSIYPSIARCTEESERRKRFCALSLSLDAQPGFGSVRRARVMETGDEGE